MSATAARRTMPVLGAALLLTVAVAVPGTATGLTCATHPADAAEQAITIGYPRDAAYRDVFIATVQQIRPEQGDAFAWGETLVIRVDAVLRGDLPMTTREVYNPPLGLAGWTTFVAGHQYLIAAGPEVHDGVGERLSTFSCAPNEEITSVDRFWELVLMSPNARLPATNLPAGGPGLAGLRVVGTALLLLAVGVAIRRTMGRDGRRIPR